MIVSKLPFWLKGPIATALQNIADAIWTWLFSFPEKAIKLGFVSTTTQTGVQIYWDALPFRPDIAAEDRRLFIATHKQFRSLKGKHDGIMLTKINYELDTFILIHPFAEMPTLGVHQFQVLRIWASWSEEKKQQAWLFLKVVIPARCIFHTQLLTWTGRPKGFGRKMGRRFGR